MNQYTYMHGYKFKHVSKRQDIATIKLEESAGLYQQNWKFA